MINMIQAQKNEAYLARRGRLALAALLVFASTGCGPGMLQTTDKQSYAIGDNGMHEVMDAKPVTITDSENMLPKLLSLAGIRNPSSATRDAGNRHAPKVSETGKADTVTAPMMIGITTVAGEVCRDLVSQERGQQASERRMFPMIDFTKGHTKITDAAKEDSIRRMARSFWGRNETAQEMVLIKTHLSEAYSGITDNGTQTENAMMFTCAAMLASLDAHRQ